MTETVSHAHVLMGQVTGRAKGCLQSQTDVIFVVLDALVKIFEDDLIALLSVVQGCVTGISCVPTTRRTRCMSHQNSGSFLYKTHWLRFRHCRTFANILLLSSLRNWFRIFCEKSETKWLEWQRRNVDTFMIVSKRSKLFHSSVEKLPSVQMSASWFLVSTYIIWILGSNFILSDNQSRATLWVLVT